MLSKIESAFQNRKTHPYSLPKNAKISKTPYYFCQNKGWRDKIAKHLHFLCFSFLSFVWQKQEKVAQNTLGNLLTKADKISSSTLLYIRACAISLPQRPFV